MNRRSLSRTPTPQRRRARRGVFLIDLLITMGVASVILATGVGLIVLIFRADTDAVAHLHTSQQTSMLSDQFRKDVHAASAAELLPQEEPKELRLTLGEGREIRWTIEDRRLIRTRTQGEQTAREVFAQPRGVNLSLDRDGELIRLSIRVEPVSRPETETRDLTLEALLNRRARWQPAGSLSESSPSTPREPRQPVEAMIPEEQET